MPRLLLIASLLLLLSAPIAQAYTCEQVRWAIANLPKEQIEAIKKQMTAEQLRAAKACLEGKATR